ncbi:hypothetical protein UFOVP1326_51 [uncultured Caudovirales phage]|uniref:Uncharacterized protein n=1 Tax=uncultured Caudovirales phage TaxID=2100421 RepID=A0A6J5RQH6_9CAUD|nr:hypothetical protein UFOVP1326_51 [uncultured Caudovirales phage]CAB4212873.1 hypothetical protein UFOVP1436_40 [uncultured Caudovirales phage]
MCNAGFGAEDVGGLATVLQVAGGGMATRGAYDKAVSDKRAYTMQAGVSENNAMLADIEAGFAADRGEQAVGRSDLKHAAVKGAQRARLAANGVDLTEGSALGILADSDLYAEEDRNSIITNTANEVYGKRMQASNARSNAAMLRERADAENPWRSALGTGLGAFGTVASGWYARRKAGLGIQIG